MSRTTYCVCLQNLHPRPDFSSSEMLLTLHKIQWVIICKFSHKCGGKNMQNGTDNNIIQVYDLNNSSLVELLSPQN